MKKTLSIILAVLMIATMVPMAFAAEATQITGVSFSGDVVTYDEASNTYIVAIPRDTEEYVLYDMIISGTNLERVATGEEFNSGYKVGFDWNADSNGANVFDDLSCFTYDAETDTTRGLFVSEVENIGVTNAVYFSNGYADDGERAWELACYIKAVWADEAETPEASDGETCPDCGGAAHGDSLAENLFCLIVMFINLIKTAF